MKREPFNPPNCLTNTWTAFQAHDFWFKYIVHFGFTSVNTNRTICKMKQFIQLVSGAHQGRALFLNQGAKRNHFWSCDFKRLISQPEGSQGFTFPHRHWSEPLKKWSSGVCKGNFVLIVETNAMRPALCSPWVTVSIKAAGSILLSNTGRRWGEKHHELVSAERERTLGIINSNRPMTVNREESV